MGILTDLWIKNPKIKFWLPIIMDVILIIGMLIFALTIKGEYKRGWDACWYQACAICLYESALQNQTGNATEVPENFTFGNITVDDG